MEDFSIGVTCPHALRAPSQIPVCKNQFKNGKRKTTSLDWNAFQMEGTTPGTYTCSMLHIHGTTGLLGFAGPFRSRCSHRLAAPEWAEWSPSLRLKASPASQQRLFSKQAQFCRSDRLWRNWEPSRRQFSPATKSVITGNKQEILSMLRINVGKNCNETSLLLNFMEKK